MSQTSEPIFVVSVDTYRGLIVMRCYEDGCEFTADMNSYVAHMSKDGRWTVAHKRREGG